MTTREIILLAIKNVEDLLHKIQFSRPNQWYQRDHNCTFLAVSFQPIKDLLMSGSMQYTFETPTKDGRYVADWPTDLRSTGVTVIEIKDGKYRSLIWHGQDLANLEGPVWIPLESMNQVIFNPKDTRWIRLPDTEQEVAG